MAGRTSQNMENKQMSYELVQVFSHSNFLAETPVAFFAINKRFSISSNLSRKQKHTTNNKQPLMPLINNRNNNSNSSQPTLSGSGVPCSGAENIRKAKGIAQTNFGYFRWFFLERIHVSLTDLYLKVSCLAGLPWFSIVYLPLKKYQ